MLVRQGRYHDSRFADELPGACVNLAEGRLVLVSPYDPSTGFNVGNAMQRNKLIYALADASLVVSSDLDEGLIEQRKRPAGYIVKLPSLFE